MYERLNSRQFLKYKLLLPYNDKLGILISSLISNFTYEGINKSATSISELALFGRGWVNRNEIGIE